MADQTSEYQSSDLLNSQNLARFNLMVTLSDYNINKRRAEKRKAKRERQIQKAVLSSEQPE